ncbi:hypothetical protein V8C35DRAFT_308800 [Trichoderma chlorosporum]
MCKEHVTIAICAPQKAPSMSFTCGKLHLVAENRQVCDKATGSCLCFVGTCGVLETVPTTEGLPISSLKSIRCAACTSREEEIGERRSNEELIGSPLLIRSAITSPEQKEKFDGIMKSLWNGSHQCPYHFTSILREESNAVVVKSDMDMEKHGDKDADKDADKESPFVGHEEETIGDNLSEASSNATHGSNNSDSTEASQESKKKEDNNGLGRKVGLQASIWAEAPNKAPESKKHTGSPRLQSPIKRQKEEVSQGPKTRMKIPQIAAAKNFLKGATVVKSLAG